MPKLKLKRTPEEEREHKLRKERKRERRKRKREDTATYQSGTSSKRYHADEQDKTREPKWASSDEDEPQFGPQPVPSESSHGYNPDYDTIKAEMEEKLFREKLFDAMGEDEMLDSVEARLNDFAHVPDRWRTSTSERKTGKTKAHHYDDDDLLKLDPAYMDDEEYAEWIRAGMYRLVVTNSYYHPWFHFVLIVHALFGRKTHAEEYAEKQRQKAAKEARRAEEKARKAEAARLDRLAEEERKMKKLERQSRRMEYARNEYHSRWTALLATTSESDTTRTLEFHDIPWPIATAYREAKADTRRRTQDTADGLVTSPKPDIGIDDLTVEAISSFILPVVGVVDVESDDATRKKERKDKLRETFLRFHPDKFEGRFMKRFPESQQGKVRDAIGQISRVLNSLMDS